MMEQTTDRIDMRLQPNPHLDIRMDIKSPGFIRSIGTRHSHPQLSRRKDLSMDMRNSFMMLYLVINHTFVHSEEVIESWRIVRRSSLHW